MTDKPVLIATLEALTELIEHAESCEILEYAGADKFEIQRKRLKEYIDGVPDGLLTSREKVGKVRLEHGHNTCTIEGCGHLAILCEAAAHLLDGVGGGE